ncbi:MAG: ABC transporter ATP-binding protein [Gammaproteobacteria bacterium]|nr:ABC transporter ATP-binding protein [Gammaproteobacteria bacterium]
MRQLPLLEGYTLSAETAEEPPRLTLRTMAQLSLRTWPYLRPLIVHLVALVGLAAVGMVTAIAGAFVGVDLFTNKVLIGEKLQPIQATVLFVGDEYVTTDPRKLGESSNIELGDSELEKDQELDNAAIEPVDQLTPDQRRTVRNRLIMWSIVGGILGVALGYGGWYYTTWIWQAVNQNLRVAMVEQAESLSLRYHDEARVGDAIFRVYQDSAMIVNLIQSGIMEPAMTLYALLVAFVVVLAFDPWIAFFGVIGAIPFIYLMVRSTPRIRRRALANRLANSNLTSHIQESFTAVKVIKANGSEPQIHRQFDEDSKRALDAAYHLRLDMVLLSLTVMFIGGVFIIGAEYVAARWVIVERETFLGAAVAGLIGFAIWNVGAFQSAQHRFDSLRGNASYLLNIWMRMQDLFIALRRAFDLLDAPVEVKESENPVDYPSSIASVSWNDVSFKYLEDGPQVLTNVSLTALAGTVTAIVGVTGSGKSTMMSLLLRLFETDGGHVRINDVDLRDLRISDVRRHCAIALQKNVLFSETVANNIGFGAGQVSRTQIERAAQIADADEFVRELEKGYDTELGERGGKLSAGQRQRLSIARAVVRDTPILILDEPTASLDARTEQRVLANLAAWGTEKVILLITHRLSTIQNADQIAFLQDGQIVETGAHDQLMANPDSCYAAFVHAESQAASAQATVEQT